MKLFSALYQWTLKWAEHKLAPKILALLTFAESVFFPVPPDVLLAPMVLAKPKRAWHYATLTTTASVIGGIAGYAMGFYMFEPWIQPLITEWDKQQTFDQAVSWFNQWGVWVVFLAGFSPIPYKIFTVSAGFLQMAFLPYLLASAIGRGMRFFLVAGIIYWGGEKMEQGLRKWIDVIGWVVVGIIILVYLSLKR